MIMNKKGELPVPHLPLKRWFTKFSEFLADAQKTELFWNGWSRYFALKILIIFMFNKFFLIHLLRSETRERVAWQDIIQKESSQKAMFCQELPFPSTQFSRLLNCYSGNEKPNCWVFVLAPVVSLALRVTGGAGGARRGQGLPGKRAIELKVGGWWGGGLNNVMQGKEEVQGEGKWRVHKASEIEARPRES